MNRYVRINVPFGIYPVIFYRRDADGRISFRVVANDCGWCRYAVPGLIHRCHFEVHRPRRTDF